MRNVIFAIALLACIGGAAYLVFTDIKNQGSSDPLIARLVAGQSGVGGPGRAPRMGGFGGGPAGGDGGRGQRMLSRLTTALNLTPGQVNEVKPILADERTKMMAIRSNTALTPDQKKAQMDQIRLAETKQITPVLTADQVPKWNAYQTQQAQRAAEWGGGGGHWGAGAPGGGPGGGPGGSFGGIGQVN